VNKPFGIEPRVFFTLLLACLMGFLAAIPYALTVQAQALQKLTGRVPQLLVIQFLVSAATSALAIGTGLRLQQKLPFFRFALLGQTADVARHDRSSVLRSGALGGGIAFGLIGGLSWLIDRILGALPLASPVAAPALWKGMLASFYGAINEEVLLRLLVMTGIAFGLAKLAGRVGLSERAIVWPAILLAAFVFGVGHLPAALGAGLRLTAGVVTRLLLLNMAGGVVFGLLYWRRGFESAVVAHFVADLCLHVLVPWLR